MRGRAYTLDSERAGVLRGTCLNRPHEKDCHFHGCVCLHSAADEDCQPDTADPPPGTAFSLKAQQVVECYADGDHAGGQPPDGDPSGEGRGLVAGLLYVSQRRCSGLLPVSGAKTKFLSDEPTAWWRKAM